MKTILKLAMAAAIAAGASVTEARAQPVPQALSTNPAERESLKAFLRRKMDDEYERAEASLRVGACKNYLTQVNDLRRMGDPQAIRNETLFQRVFLSPAEREDLITYNLRLRAKLPRDCPPKTAAAQTASGTSGPQISIGAGAIWTRPPQVQGGTRFDAATGTEVGILKSDRTLTGPSGTLYAQFPMPASNSRWGDYSHVNISISYSRFDGSAQGSVPIGGDNVAQTYIIPNPVSGSTGIFAGATGQSVNIQSNGHYFDAVFGLVGMPVSRFFLAREMAGETDGVRFQAGFGLRYRNSSIEHGINQQSLTFPGVNSVIDLEVNSHFVAPNLSFGANIMPSGSSGMFFGAMAFVAPGVLITNANATQNSRCNVCPAAEQNITLSRDFSSTSFAAMMGVDVKVGYQVNPAFKVQFEGGLQHMSRADSIAVPITPTQQPIHLDSGTSSSAYLGLRAVFSQPPAPPP